MPKTINHIDDHGYFKSIKVVRKKQGNKNGISNLELDDHAMSYLIKGLNCRIEHYELQLQSGPLADDDQVSFDYTVQLRDSVEQARNEIL